MLCVIAGATIDVNLPEFTYLANHLQPEECRRLVASLHYKSYNKPNALDDAGRYNVYNKYLLITMNLKINWLNPWFSKWGSRSLKGCENFGE